MRLPVRLSVCLSITLVLAFSAGVEASAANVSPGTGIHVPARGATSLTPVFARSILVVPESANVYITVPGGPRTPLFRAQLAPSGSVVDVLGQKAAAELVAAGPRGVATETADVSGAAFQVTQPPAGKGVTNLVLMGNAQACTTARDAQKLSPARVRVPSTHKPRYARDAGAGVAAGQFRLVGKNQSAVNQGQATWQGSDGCHQTTISDNGGTVQTTMGNGANAGDLEPGWSWISQCSPQPQSPTIGPYCVGIRGANDFRGFVAYAPALFMKTTATTYDLCQTTPAGPQACQTWSFTVPDAHGYRTGIVVCPTNQAGSYSMSWQIPGTTLNASLPYTSRVAARAQDQAPCAGMTGTDFNTGNHILSLPSRIKIVNSYTLPTAGWLDWLSADLVGKGTGRESLVGVVYQDAGGSPGRLVASTQRCWVSGSDTSNCDVLSFFPEVNLTAGTYWFGLLTSGKSNVVSVQEGHTAVAFYNDNALSAASDPFGAAQTAEKRLSLQINYSLTPPSTTG